MMILNWVYDNLGKSLLLVIFLGIVLGSIMIYISKDAVPQYTIFYVDEMPCVSTGRGLSCDWSQWK